MRHGVDALLAEQRGSSRASVDMTALFHYMAVSAGIRDLHWKVENDNRDLRYEISDLRRDVSAVQREIKFRAEQDDRDVERILYETRRSR